MIANFRSDNESAVAGPVLEAIAAANHGAAHAYAEDDWSLRLDQAFSELFETPTRVLPLATGTAANSIALATVTPPWGSVLCHRQAHVYSDESGAPEFFGHGLRLVTVDGPLGRMTPDALAHAYAGCAGHGVHSYVPSAMTLTQSTESGTVYATEELAALYGQARHHGLATHLDGARFANAVARLGCSPADSSWRAGVEMLSFGASKNGCMAAEALVFFGDARDARYETAERMRKRSGHLFSKMRYLSAQLLAYIDNDLWLQLAAHANAQAARFAETVARHAVAELEYPVEANEVFVRWTEDGFQALADAGIEFLTWPGQDDLARFVFSHATTDAETDRLITALGG